MSHQLLAFVSIVLLASASSSEALFLKPLLIAEGVDDEFQPLADVYALRLFNTLDQPINALRFDLGARDFGVSNFLTAGGGFYHPSDLSIGGILWGFRGGLVADSFVVIPEGLIALQGTPSVFTAERFAATYTVAGSLVGANEVATIAHLSVPAGESLIPGNPLVGLIDASGIAIPIVPEPSAGLLSLLVIAGFAIRSRI